MILNLSESLRTVRSSHWSDCTGLHENRTSVLGRICTDLPCRRSTNYHSFSKSRPATMRQSSIYGSGVVVVRGRLLNSFSTGRHVLAGFSALRPRNPVIRLETSVPSHPDAILSIVSLVAGACRNRLSIHWLSVMDDSVLG